MYSQPYSKTLHYFALFTASATFLLILAGALVTSNGAGLSVPDWPTSFGSLYRLPRMVNGVQFEHTHRMIAEFIGLLTIIIAAWTWRADRRSWMKKLALGALATVIVQGILGGVTVLKLLPPLVSTAHAIVGQTFFCIAVCIAMFTGRRWIGEEPRTTAEDKRPTLLMLSLLSIAVLYLQLFLGGMYRHNGMTWHSHVTNAALVTVILSWTSLRALSRFAKVDAVRRPAKLLLGLLIVQLGLGFLAFVEKVMLEVHSPAPVAVFATAVHTATGALLLATAVVLAIQTWRLVPVPHTERLRAESQKAVTA